MPQCSERDNKENDNKLQDQLSNHTNSANISVQSKLGKPTREKVINYGNTTGGRLDASSKSPIDKCCRSNMLVKAGVME